ncbi:transcriptional regulator [Oceanobacillus oncorhynchi subsp. incaldanensis]|uniref:helix-turn-helix domain-containing protein n=1 Tax=Oceanobacillus oncorhynchi TaxID=545501 RepID=UPI001B20EE9C|nr:helix-turn-helix transcriptional regulator [Oceanobacillus oncorhynchi]GIO20604.1 transcriptional regulator [Oceanobacillus oncorhynchi subsp. incaldanensis]
MKTNKKQKQILMTLGDNIRHYRTKKGWSQEDLAFELHRTYIGAVKRGKRSITVLNLIKIKNELGVRLDELYPETYT